MRREWFGVLIALSLICACEPVDNGPSSYAGRYDAKNFSQPPVADRIFINGNVYSFSWKQPDGNGVSDVSAPKHSDQWLADAQAIAISGGKVLAVGANDDIRHYANELTEVIDLKNATVIPGLIDSHVHIEQLSNRLNEVDLVGSETPSEVVSRIQNYLQKNPKSIDQWIIGYGWDEGAWNGQYPNRKLLDRYFPDHAVVLKGRHGFALWANSQALVESNIDARTEAPVGGQILKDAQGLPSGILLNRATDLILKSIPKPSSEQFEDSLLRAFEEMARSGYVAIHQAGADRHLLTALQNLSERDQLPLRVYVLLSSRDPELMQQWLSAGPSKDPNGFLDIGGVKAYYDGSLGARGALLIDDYTDKHGVTGIGGVDYQFPRELVTAAIQRGFQLAIHAIGDAGNRQVLDLYQEQYSLNPSIRQNRHRIEHAQVLSETDLARFSELDIIASMQPAHAVEDRLWAERRLGRKRMQHAYAWRSLRQHQVDVLLNSDAPGSDHSFFYGLHSAVTRQDKMHQPTNGWYAGQALTAEEVVFGYTRWPAYAAFRELQSGQIAPGYWADFTVVDRDILNVAEQSPPALLDGLVVMTIVNGRLVYREGQI